MLCGKSIVSNLHQHQHAESASKQNHASVATFDLYPSVNLSPQTSFENKPRVTEKMLLWKQTLRFLSLTARHQKLLYSSNTNSLPILTLFTKKNVSRNCLMYLQMSLLLLCLYRSHVHCVMLQKKHQRSTPSRYYGYTMLCFVSYCSFLQFVLEEVCIDLPGNEVWRDKYKNDIPVFHLRGEYLMKHRVNEKLLVNKLTELQRSKMTSYIICIVLMFESAALK